MIYFSKPGTKNTLQNYGQSPTERIAYGNSLISDKLSNFTNEPISRSKDANFPKTSDGGIVISSMKAFINNNDGFAIAPVQKAKPPLNFDPDADPNDPNLGGIVGSIYDFDLVLVKANPFNNTLDILSGFVPANMTYTTDTLNGEPIVTSATPNGSAFLTTQDEYWEYRRNVGKELVNKIKNLPPFSEIIEETEELTDEKRSIAAAKWLIANNLLPEFYIPKQRDFTTNTIKNTYCKTNKDTGELIEEKCGLAEDHELQFMLQTVLPIIVGVFAPSKYRIISYPCALNDFVSINEPQCHKCYQWYINCTIFSEINLGGGMGGGGFNWNWGMDGDDGFGADTQAQSYTNDNISIQQFVPVMGGILDESILKIEPYDPDFFPDGFEPDFKIFTDYDEAKIELQQQLNIPENQYKYCFILNKCRKIHPLCYTSDSWTESYPSEEFPLHDTLEDCEDSLVYVVICNDNSNIEIIPESSDDEQNTNVKDKYDNLGDPYLIFPTKEEAEDYAGPNPLDNGSPKLVFLKDENGFCFGPIHRLCSEKYPGNTYDTLEECENDNGSGISGGSGTYLSSATYFFDPLTNAWILKN